MKQLLHRAFLIILIVVSVSTTSFLQEYTQSIIPDGGGNYFSQITEKAECISQKERKAITNKKKENIKYLDSESLLNLSGNESRSQVSLDWPLRVSPELSFNSYYSITNFVDLNPNTGSGSFNQFESTNLDYNCGNRSYDTNNGYNHSGIDIMTWPFEWYIFENNFVEVIAAQSGTIIYKEDGNYDQNCSCNGDSNTLIIQHSDGSEAWYLHLKKNSLTNLSVGDNINQGDYIGIVGSSGCSTNPHLHFEIRDANDNVIEPYSGSCNSTTNSSWWASQKPYRESTINALFTHFDVPELGCPGSGEEPNIGTNFNPGDQIITAGYFRDQLENDLTVYKIIKPNGTVWKSWSHAPEKDYSASYWYWTHFLPSSAECGEWTLEADFSGNTYNYIFEVGNVPPAAIIANGPTEFCDGESVTLTANGGTSYLWTGPNGFTSNNQNITASQNGEYIVEVTNSSNCNVSESQFVTVYSNPLTSSIIGISNPESNAIENYQINNPDPQSTYEWDITNGTILSGQGTSTVTVEWSSNEYGFVCVVETSSNGCLGEENCLEIQLILTSTESINQNTIELFPNPTSDMLFVSGISSSNSDEIFIFNPLGRRVEVNSRVNEGLMELDLSSLQSGIYCLMLKDNGLWSVYKFVKK